MGIEDLLKEVGVYIQKLNKKACVSGFITKLTVTPTHAYFTLEDYSTHSIRVYINAHTLNKLYFKLQDQQEVDVEGTICLFINSIQIRASEITLITESPYDINEDHIYEKSSYNTYSQPSKIFATISKIFTIIKWIVFFAILYYLYKLFF